MEGNERAVPLLMVHLNNLEDPRPGKNTRHSFFEIMFISICALICSCESYEEIADFAYAKRDWLSKFISFDEGIPSHDTFRRVFCILNFEVFQKMFLSWTGASLIREKGGDYLLALKGNQSGLLEAVEEVFRRNSTANYKKNKKRNDYRKRTKEPWKRCKTSL